MIILEITDKSELFEPLFNVYTQYFPEIERNTLESVKGYLHECSYNRFWDYLCLVALTDDGIIAGGLYLNVFYDIKAIVMEFLFVKEKYRDLHVATGLMDYVNKQFPNFCNVIEVEKDNPVQNFWTKMGFKKSDFEYVQPPIVEGRKDYDGLMLMVKGECADLDNVIREHYWKYAFSS